MKKTFNVLFASALITSVLIAPIAHASSPVICLAYDTGGPGDSSFNDAAQAGLKVAAKNLQFTLETTVTSGDAKDRTDRLTALVKKNCTMVGYASQRELFEKGFTPGAKSAKKSITTSVRYISSSASKETSSLVRSGYDVIYLTTTGSATEVFSAIVSSNNARKNKPAAGIITVEPDQFLSVTTSTKKLVLATVIKRVDLALIDLLTKTLEGSSLYDEVDPVLGVYGHRYGISDKSIEITLRSPALISKTSAVNTASIAASKLN